MNDDSLALLIEIGTMVSLTLLLIFPRLILRLVEPVRRSRRRENMSKVIIGIRVGAVVLALYFANKFWGDLIFSRS